MATTTITALAAGTALAGTEVAPFDQGGSTVKITATQIKTLAVGAGSVSVASGKTLTTNNSLTLAGTDSTTMTFPTTSATIARTDAAQTFTGTQTINPAANTSATVVSGGSITGSGTTVPGITVSGTLNSSGAIAGAVLFGNITNTASAATTTLAELQTGGSTLFAVRATDGRTRIGKSTDGLYIGGGDASSLTGYGGIWHVTVTPSNTNYAFVTGSNADGAVASTYINCLGNSGNVGVLIGNTSIASAWSTGWKISTSKMVGWNDVVAVSNSGMDTAIGRNTAGVVEVNNGTAGTYRDLKLRNIVGQTGYSEMVEMTAPSAPAANTVRIYAEDNGAGKTRLMALFPSGAAQQIAIEP